MTGIAIFEPGKEFQRDDGTTGVSMNIKKVFDVSQTAARNRQQAAPAHDTRTLLKALMNNSPAPIKLVDQLSAGTGAHYNEQRGVIEVERGLDGESLYRCMAQEIAYAELAKQNPETLQCADKGFAAYAASYSPYGNIVACLCPARVYRPCNFVERSRDGRTKQKRTACP
jgi:hypothetical protein